MSTRTTLVISLVLIVIALLAGALLWDRLPDQMASHWNESDQVDGYMPKFWGVFLMPLITLAMLALFIVIPVIDPLKANIAQFRETFNVFIVLIIAFMLYIQGLTLAWSLGIQEFKMSAAMLPFLGLLFIFVGNLMRKAKRNFFIGIRTPWTLSSEAVWNATHRLGSKLFMLAGVATIFAALMGETGFWVMTVTILSAAFVPIVYSYVLWRRENP